MDILITLLEIKNLKKTFFQLQNLDTVGSAVFTSIGYKQAMVSTVYLKISRKLSLETICIKRTNDDEKSIFMGSRILVK